MASGRLRGLVLWQIFRTLCQRAQPDTRVNAVVEFRITGCLDGGFDRYQLRFADGRCTRSRHGGHRPALTIEVGPVAFLRLVGGTSSPGRLLLSGKLKLWGDLMLAVALPAALRLPNRSTPAPWRDSAVWARRHVRS